MIFRKANFNELSDIYYLYKSVIGSKFCTWNDVYPGMQEIEHDFETGNLFILFDKSQIIGSASIVPENELDSLSFWKFTDGTQREIARVVISECFQGQGLAVILVNSLIQFLKTTECHSVHLSVASKNIPAIKTYYKIGFATVGETDMYNNHYYLLEKEI